ncbi:hypothetical protein WME90_43750 [Sorangium sp. So ce375]
MEETSAAGKRNRLGNVLLSAPFSGSVDLGGGALTTAGALDAFVAKLTP